MIFNRFHNVSKGGNSDSVLFHWHFYILTIDILDSWLNNIVILLSSTLCFFYIKALKWGGTIIIHTSWVSVFSPYYVVTEFHEAFKILLGWA